MSNVMPAIYNVVLLVIQKVMHITKNEAAPALSSCQPVVIYCVDSKRQQSPRDVNSALFTTQTRKKPLVVKQEVHDKRTVVFACSVEAHDSDSEEL